MLASQRSHSLSTHAQSVDSCKCTSTHLDIPSIVARPVLAYIMLFYWSSMRSVHSASPVQLRHHYVIPSFITITSPVLLRLSQSLAPFCFVYWKISTTYSLTINGSYCSESP